MKLKLRADMETIVFKHIFVLFGFKEVLVLLIVINSCIHKNMFIVGNV